MQNRLLIVVLVALAVSIVLALIAHRFVSKDRMWRIYRRSALTLVIFVCLGLGAEIVTRLAYPSVDMGGKDWAFLRQFSDPSVVYQMNRLGYREHEVAEQPAAGVVRIAAVGDSITEGEGVAVKDRMSNMLEARLNSNGDSFEVVNFGIGGNEYPGHIATMKLVLDQVHPDFVLLQWFINDMEGDSKIGRPRIRYLLPSSRLHHFLLTNSVLYKIAQNEWRSLQVKLGLTDSYWTYLNGRFKDENGADYQRAKDELVTLFEMAKEAQVPIAMVLFPEFTPTIGPDYPIGYLMDRARAICLNYSSTCIDLRPLFDGSMALDEIIVSKVSLHPTRRINEMATNVVLEALEPTFQALQKASRKSLQSALHGND